jgi:hypothetical protein
MSTNPCVMASILSEIASSSLPFGVMGKFDDPSGSGTLELSIDGKGAVGGGGGFPVVVVIIILGVVVACVGGCFLYKKKKNEWPWDRYRRTEVTVASEAAPA